jgi:cell division protein DivIC
MKFLPSFITNKYLLASTFFVSWLLFFDHNDVFTSFKRSQELNELKAKMTYYQEQIDLTQKEVDALRLNAASLEKVAREKYLMKKDNEDLYIIEEKEK